MPPGWRWQFIWPPVLITVMIVGTALAALRPSDNPGKVSAAPPALPSVVTTTSSAIPSATLSSLSTSSEPPSSSLTTAAPTSTVLGRDLKPIRTEDCHAPGVGTGAAWQVMQARVGGTDYTYAYSCALFASQSGSLDFDLGRRFQTLQLTIGFDNASRAKNQSVQFDLVADGKINLSEPIVLSLGESKSLSLDVAEASRLTLKVADLSRSSNDTSPSRPVFAMPTLGRA